jgi:1-acyl-sn-glycerol-3-phosphate acyltransferase
MNAHFVADTLALLARLVSGATVRTTSNDLLAGSGQRVYVANHTSHLDFIVLWAALPTNLRRVTRPVAAKDYWEKSALRRYLAVEVYRAILIDRDNPSAHNNPIELINSKIGDEFSIIIFPEGTRGTGEEIGDFKSGVYHIVGKKPELQCVPVYIENLNRVLPKGEVLPIPLLSSITFGAPIVLQHNEHRNAFLQRLRDAVIALKVGRDNL